MNDVAQINLPASHDIAQVLKQHQIVPTAQRQQIAAELLCKHQHVSADQLYHQLYQQGTQVSKATIYNTLGLFVEKGLLREICIDSSRSYYDSNTSPHHHIFNEDTGELIDISEAVLQGLDQSQLPSQTRTEQVELLIRVRNS
ncbi:Fur family transcriptional regulator [Motiliproteus sp.]|uniref:Fur family transcriptional regulator n=1 Tax=Motiliproteus sp. TaxID=1898955 RepID=UPI003BA9411B